MDPSTTQDGPKALLRNQDKIADFLKQNNLAIAWTVMGEKMGIGGKRDQRTGRLMINGAFTFDGKKLIGGINTTYEQ